MGFRTNTFRRNNMIEELTLVANKLDDIGMTKEADVLDKIIMKIADEGASTFDPDEAIKEHLFEWSQAWSSQDQHVMSTVQRMGGNEPMTEPSEQKGGITWRRMETEVSPGHSVVWPENVQIPLYPSLMGVFELLTELKVDTGKTGQPEFGPFNTNEVMAIWAFANEGMGYPITFEKVQHFEGWMTKEMWGVIRNSIDGFKKQTMSGLSKALLAKLEEHNKGEGVQYTREQAQKEIERRLGVGTGL